MAESNEQKSGSSRFKSLVVLGSFIIVGVFIMLLMREHSEYSESVQAELAIVKNSIGPSDWEKVREKTVTYYDKWFHDSGLYKNVFEAMIPTQETVWDEVVDNVATESFGQRLAYNAQVFAYQVTHRLIMFEYWVWILLPSLIAVIWTGVNAYRAKTYMIGGVKPNAVRLYLKTTWVTVNLTLCYLMVPNIIGNWVPFTPAILLLLFAILVMGIIQSFGKGAN